MRFSPNTSLGNAGIFLPEFQRIVVPLTRNHNILNKPIYLLTEKNADFAFTFPYNHIACLHPPETGIRTSRWKQV